MKSFNLFGYEISINKKGAKSDLMKDIDTTYYSTIPSLTNAITLKAHQETMDYISKYVDLSEVTLCDNRWKNIEFCLQRVKNLAGMYMEFGVYTGRSINYIAKRIGGNRVHGFDSFEGLPDDWSGFNMQSGHFNLNGALPAVEENVILYKGWFDKTLPMFLKQNNEKVAFLHMDSDIYDSTKTVLDLLAKRLQVGTVIVFDEYFNYPNWQNHEFKAFQEFVKENGIKFKYISFGKLQVGVEITALGDD